MSKSREDCGGSKSDDEFTNGKSKSSGGAIPKKYSSPKSEQSASGKSKSKSPMGVIGKIFSSPNPGEKSGTKSKSPLGSAVSFFGKGRFTKSPSGEKNVSLSSDSEISPLKSSTKNPESNPELVQSSEKKPSSDSVENEMKQLEVTASSSKPRDSCDIDVIDDDLLDKDKSKIIYVENSKKINEMAYEENDNSLISGFDHYCYDVDNYSLLKDVENYSLLKDVYTNPIYSESTMPKSSKTKSKDKSTEKTKPIPISHKSVQIIEKTFPDAAFTLESPPPNWTASKKFLRSLFSSPEKESTDTDEVAVPCPDLVSEETEVNRIYKYKDGDVIRNSWLFLKVQYLHYSYIKRYVVLLKNGHLLIYEETDKQTVRDRPYLMYNLMNCEFNKVKIPKSENEAQVDTKSQVDKKARGDKKKYRGDSHFEVHVTDIIKKTLLSFMADTKNLRDEWLNSLQYQKRIIEEKLKKQEKIYSKVEMEIKQGATTDMGDFQISKSLGGGAFGKIVLCKHTQTGHQYLMKMMRKDVIAIYDGGAAVLNEYRALRNYKHPFLQKMKYTFLNDKIIVFGMQYPVGGPLAAHIFETRKFSEEIAIFYGFQLATAMMYLHSKNILVRALTINNLHLDKYGNLKLLDFGLRYALVGFIRHSWFVKNRPAYVAPENAIYDHAYSFTSDWWAFGICMLVMATGEEPLKDMDYNLVSETMKTKSRPIEYNSENMSIHMKDFMKRILATNHKKRIGCSNDQEEILEHKIFDKLVYASEQDIKIGPPIRPLVKNKSETTLLQDVPVTLEDIPLTPPPRAEKYLLKSDQVLPAGFEDLKPYESLTMSSCATNLSSN